MFLGTSVLLYQLGTEFALTAIATISSYILFTFYVTQKRIEIRKRLNAAENRLNSFAFDSLLNFELVKYFQNRNVEVNEYLKKFQDYLKQGRLSSISFSILGAGQIGVFTMGHVSILLSSINRIQSGLGTIGDMVLANGLMWQIYQPLFYLGMIYRQTSKSLVDLENLIEVTGDNETTTQNISALKLAQNQELKGLRPLTSNDFLTKDIVFDNVAYGYPGSDITFRNLSFKITPGTSLGIVGSSGSG